MFYGGEIVKLMNLTAIVSRDPGSFYERIISFRAPYHGVTVIFQDYLS